MAKKKAARKQTRKKKATTARKTGKRKPSVPNKPKSKPNKKSKKKKPTAKSKAVKKQAVKPGGKKKKSVKKIKRSSLGRPRIAGDARLDQLFQKDYQAREIFEFLGVATLKELEMHGPDEIIERLTGPHGPNHSTNSKDFGDGQPQPRERQKVRSRFQESAIVTHDDVLS